jgi:hypothetical protein
LNLLTRFRAWRRRTRRQRAAEQQEATLREFVYLDEVSVYSLLASRLGPLATEFTDTETASLKVEVAGSGAGTETGSQVLRKSIVQTSFKELYELEVSSLAMRPADQQTKLPTTSNLDDLVATKEILLADGWLIDPEVLGRGSLVELEVQLESEDIFRASSIVSVALDIIDANPEMFGVDVATLGQAKTAGRVLEKLLVGLVPVSGLAVDYNIVRIVDKEWIVHRRLVNQIQDIEPSSVYPLYIVGVAEQSLFWKDVRRILFANARFRVLCRVAQNGIRDSWKPVKLAQILDLVKPGLGQQIDELGSIVLASMITATARDQNHDRKRLVRDALIRYGELVGESYGTRITSQELSVAGLPSEQQCTSFGTLEERRNAFDLIAEFVKDRAGVELEPMLIAQLRGIALQEAGLDLLGNPMPIVTASDPSSVRSATKRFLDSEFVAIYW